MLRIAIHGYTSADLADLQTCLTDLIRDSSGWILTEKILSPTAFHLSFEIGLHQIIELYAALQQTGIQFTPLSHRALAEMCLCRKYLTRGKTPRFVCIDLYLGALAEESLEFRRLDRPVFC